VTSSIFEGKQAMQWQQLVYKAIWEELQGPEHAIDSMICKSPNEASLEECRIVLSQLIVK
jgi:stress-induced morphogen